MALSSPLPFFIIYGWITYALYMWEDITGEETMIFASIVDFRHLQILCHAPHWECNLIFIWFKAGFSDLLDQIIENGRGYAIPMLGLGFKRTDSFSVPSRAVSEHKSSPTLRPSFREAVQMSWVFHRKAPQLTAPHLRQLFSPSSQREHVGSPTPGDPLAECSRKSSVSTTWNRTSAW